MKIASTVVIACLVACASAHMCMISPQQRGGFQAETLTTAGTEIIYTAKTKLLKIRSYICMCTCITSVNASMLVSRHLRHGFVFE